MSTRLTLALLIGTLLTGLGGSAGATPISYSETASGDLVGLLPAPTVFNLDVGVNTVSGTITGSTTTVERDSFAFEVPAGTALTNISFAFVESGTATFGSTTFFLDNDNQTHTVPFLSSQVVDVFGTSPVLMFASRLPLGPGIYGIEDFSFSATNGTWSANYTWALTVESSTPTPSPVPEPASVVLLASGLIAPALQRHRRRRQSVGLLRGDSAS